ncbi:MAG: response regulator transcription factor [Parvibaculaceae bacterium]
MVPKSILIADGDAALYQALSEQLELGGLYQCVSCIDAASAFAALAQQTFDLVLLDAGLPDMDGKSFCVKLRQDNFTVPLIMMSDAPSEDEATGGLEAGANDYVVKPFRFAVLLAKVRGQLRAQGQGEEADFVIGPYAFRPAAKLLTGENDRKVRLTEKETNILKYLLQAGQNVVGREELLAEVWGYNSGVTTHTLETHIYRLRQKIEADPSQATILVTDAGGYRLVA